MWFPNSSGVVEYAEALASPVLQSFSNCPYPLQLMTPPSMLSMDPDKEFT